MQKLLLTTDAEFDGLAPSWRALEQQLTQVLPFQTYDWNRCWWRTFAVRSLLRRDQLAIIALYDQDRLVALAPLLISRIGIAGVTLYRYIRPFGSDPNLTEIRIPLALPGYQAALMQAVLDLQQQHSTGMSECQLIADQAQAEAALAQRPFLQALDQRTIPNFILPLAGDWEHFRIGLKRNIKESIRRCYNSLARAQLSPRLQVLQGRIAISAQLDLFYTLHGVRAAAETTVKHPDYFLHPQHKQFIGALLDSPFAERMQLFCLHVGQNIVAVRLGFLMGDELYLYYSGYDLAFAKYSVMTTLLVEVIRWSMEQKLQRINLSVGEDVSKTRWGPELTEYVEIQFVKDGWWRNRVIKTIIDFRKRRQSLIAD
ncbi:GNAT family N-acetyltransferase [Undibacterium sp. Jales W-56]|uniref:GNAT family N-acetyltransferase n=1 Tax=Undibacterium sp. Jales W-56 TaxID=2897325 RepID=UPI0021CE4BC4|nr:GNAT family N-acetyltransferase [Undibacterium sp. Jales W-56]MCU6434326.1 GNAT family N-acetyltransferase [Undibacterium sp. Jales W-56]